MHQVNLNTMNMSYENLKVCHYYEQGVCIARACTIRILPILTSLFCSLCWVASPQSKSHTSPPKRRAKAEWFLVDDGCAEAVPRNVMFIAEKLVFDMVVTAKGLMTGNDSKRREDGNMSNRNGLLSRV